MGAANRAHDFPQGAVANENAPNVSVEGVSRLSCGQLPFTASRLALYGVPHDDGAAICTGNAALDVQQIPFRIDFDHFQVLDGHGAITHVAGHFGAFEGHTRGESGADRTAVTVIFVDTVAGLEAREVVATHDALKALALGGALDIDQLTVLKGVGQGELAAGGELAGRFGVDAEFLDDLGGRCAGLGEMAHFSLGGLLFFAGAAAELNGVVAIATRSQLDLQDGVGGEFDHGDGADGTVGGEDLGHAQFAADKAEIFVCHESLALDGNGPSYGIRTEKNRTGETHTDVGAGGG